MPLLAAHADWSIDPRKRWLALARRAARGWRVAAPCLVGPAETFLARLLGDAEGEAVALGVDLPVGGERRQAVPASHERRGCGGVAAAWVHAVRLGYNWRTWKGRRR